jgi:anti-sigma B factor antagonist
MTSACVRATDDDISYEIHHQQGCAIVVTAGDIDLHSAPYLREALEAASVLSETVVVDLTDSQFVDSSGLGVLVGAHRRGRQRAVSLVKPPPILRKLLRLTRLGAILTVYETRAEALAALGGIPGSDSPSTAPR